MDSREEEERPLTAAEQCEIEGYNRIIAYHNLIVSGKHPTIKLTHQQLAKNGGAPPGPIEPVNVLTSTHAVDPMSHLSGRSNKEISIPTSKDESGFLKAPERLGELGEPRPRSDVKTLQKRAPLSVKEVVTMWQPFQTSSTPPAGFTNINGPPAPQDKISRLKSSRGYHHELGIASAATNVDICNAFQAVRPASAIKQEAYDVLPDDYLRDTYDDARPFALRVAKLLEVPEKEPEKKPEKKPKLDLKVNYYKALGVQSGPNTTENSIKRAYKHKVSVYNDSVRRRRLRKGVLNGSLLEDINVAYAILSDNKLRKEYDLRRGIPSHTQAPLDKGRSRQKM